MDDALAAIRRHYAEELQYVSGLRSQHVVDAFARVPRERFLGPGPWRIVSRGGRTTPDADPRHLYHNVLVSIVEARSLNNGQPSFLAHLMDESGMKPGEHVVHLGAGVGYYSAVMAEVVGPEGRVTAIEADPDLAARAVENLADRDNVHALHGDGLEAEFEDADVIFVNFGLTHPHRPWLERLRPGGRLQVPITASTGLGMVMRFEHTEHGVAAQPISPTQIFASVSGRDPALEARLTQVYSAGPLGAGVVASLRLDEHARDGTCWLHRADVCLSTVPLVQDGPLARYLGAFQCTGGPLLTFTARDAQLFVTSPLGAGPLTSVGEDVFEAPGVARFEFGRSDPQAPQVDRLTLRMGERTLDGERVS